MAANLANHDPIRVYQTSTNTTEQTQGYLEAAGQTFLDGTPVQVAGSTVGYCKAWDGTTVLAQIIGIAPQAGMNLSSNGAGAAPAFGSIGFPGTPTTYGTVPNQTSAVNIPAGATFSDGMTLVYQAVPTTLFIGQVDNSAAGAYAPSVANIGLQYGLTIDATGHWYVDFNKSTAGTNTVVEIVGLYPNDLAAGSATTEINGGHVIFKFIPAAVAV
jgi:hypothetical protein